MKNYKLMIKTHSVTDLKYLCITSREKWEEYTGSGTYWSRHLKKHGYHFSTILLYEDTDYEEFVKICIMYSELYNVANCPKFANLIPESGYGAPGKPNITVFWELADEETKKVIYKKRRDTLMNSGNHWAHDPLSKIPGIISQKQKEFYSKFTKEELFKMTENIRAEAAKFHQNRETDTYKEYVALQSLHMTTRFEAMTPEDRISYGNSITVGRNNMSEDAKVLRGVRVGESFKTSEKRIKFNADMKIKRNGLDNPNAVKVTWFGEEMSKSDLHSRKLKRSYIKLMFETRDDCFIEEKEVKIYETLECPHCKVNSGGKKLSAFRRWHLDNCKENKNENRN